jgi:tellurite resistance protein
LVLYFIIIYGTYGITYSKGKGGDFFCPDCTHTTTYRHKRVRRFFHIFWIPLIPLDLAGEYVECGACLGTYRVEVLELSQMVLAAAAAGSEPNLPKHESEADAATRRILVLMMLADGVIDESEIDMIVDILSTDDNEVTRDEVLAEVELARNEPPDVESYCRAAMGYLNDEGKERILTSARAVAIADGHIDPSEQKLLERIGVALGMKPSRVTSSLASVAPPNQPTA